MTDLAAWRTLEEVVASMGEGEDAARDLVSECLRTAVMEYDPGSRRYRYRKFWLDESEVARRGAQACSGGLSEWTTLDLFMSGAAPEFPDAL